MQSRTLGLLNEVNRAIIKFRGIYSVWAGRHGISYHEMLVYYTIREYGSCTQKQICESYLLPKQTINNVFAALRKKGVIEQSGQGDGREKKFVLTPSGSEYAQPFLQSLEEVEDRAVALMGSQRLADLTGLLLEYDRALNSALEEEGNGGKH